LPKYSNPFNFQLMKWPKLLPDLDVNTKITLSIVACFATGILTYLSIFGLAGNFGRVIGAFLAIFLGRGSVILPVIFFLMGVILIRIQRNNELVTDVNSRLAWGFFFLAACLNGFLSLFMQVKTPADVERGGGLFGYFIYPISLGYFGLIGGAFILICIGFFGFFLVSNLTFTQFLENVKHTLKNPAEFWDFIPDIFEIWKNPNTVPITEGASKIEDRPAENLKEFGTAEVAGSSKNNPKTNDKPYKQDVIDVQARPVSSTTKTAKPKFSFAGSEKDILEMQPTENLVDWKLPPFDILKENHTKVEPGDIEGNKKTIKETLAHFGISVEMGDVSVGPTVTQYTLKPANGVRLSAIDALQRDLALALASSNIRVESPVNGQSLVGVEVPNKQKSMVLLRDILQTHKFLNFPDELAIAMGKDVSGNNVIFALSKMPHLLVAGSTGSGKSVWINGLLLSLLYRYSPSELQLILVDMKRVELKLYDKVPHLLAPVITDADKAINALKWTVLEMERRYKLLEEHGKRNIADYNKLAKLTGLESLPYQVFVIDELGDLMMMAKAEVEPIIVRLTQMSRAVGIHLVLGTQRPDTHVVTGLIKANVPSRIAFAVASQIDSRVILDQGGAEKLLGQGDGLFMNPNSMYAIRFQGPNVSDEEVKKCVEYLKRLAEDNDNFSNLDLKVLETPKVKINVPGMVNRSDDDAVDDVYTEARNLVIQYQKASASFLQQMMGIGYPKAARIIQQLEEEGVVGPQNGSKPRDVYSLPEEE
jgi:DNA segregation ATPase FtsK/SpoIIIE, S-DNA-T family